MADQDPVDRGGRHVDVLLGELPDQLDRPDLVLTMQHTDRSSTAGALWFGLACEAEAVLQPVLALLGPAGVPAAQCLTCDATSGDDLRGQRGVTVEHKSRPFDVVASSLHTQPGSLFPTPVSPISLGRKFSVAGVTLDPHAGHDAIAYLSEREEQVAR